MAPKAKTGITLPWEGRGDRFRGLLAGPRWKVLLILLSLGAVLYGVYWVTDSRRRARATRVSLDEVHRAINRFRAEIGRCPDSPEELLRPPRAGTRYLREIPLDGWGREFFIQCPGHFNPDSADVISAGPSGDLFMDDNLR